MTSAICELRATDLSEILSIRSKVLQQYLMVFCRIFEFSSQLWKSYYRVLQEFHSYTRRTSQTRQQLHKFSSYHNRRSNYAILESSYIPEPSIKNYSSPYMPRPGTPTRNFASHSVLPTLHRPGGTSRGSNLNSLSHGNSTRLDQGKYGWRNDTHGCSGTVFRLISVSIPEFIHIHIN